MADETTTGAKKEVAIDTEAQTEQRKKLIKYVVIAGVLLLAYWLVKKYVL